MSRQSRIDTLGALHHIIARGIGTLKIFNDDKDRYNFVERLETVLKQTRTGKHVQFARQLGLPETTISQPVECCKSVATEENFSLNNAKL